MKEFKKSPNEHTLYIMKNNDGNVLIVCIYVDDMIYMSSSQELINEFKYDMKITFEMIDLRSLHYFWGWR